MNKPTSNPAKNGDTVKFHYTGKLVSGSVFDSSSGQNPLEIILGQGWIIKGLEEAILGMRVGEKKNVKVPVSKGYGEPSKDKVIPTPLSKFPSDVQFEEGQMLEFEQPDGMQLPVKVLRIENGIVYFDANHPLAGKELMFDIEIVSITENSSKESNTDKSSKPKG